MSIKSAINCTYKRFAFNNIFKSDPGVISPLSYVLIFQLGLGVFLSGCGQKNEEIRVAQYTTYEIMLQSEQKYKNAYTDVEVWAVFTNQQQDTMLRPAFWDGDSSWKIRFSPVDTNEIWYWQSFSSNKSDNGLSGQHGSFLSVSKQTTNQLVSEGPLGISPGKRSLIHHSGKPFLMVANTGWASPFRATVEQVEEYAASCQKKGFNTVLLAVLQTDMKAEGPDERNTPLGFKRAFRDLKDGHLNELDVDYFQYLDNIIATYLTHELVPVIAPLLHGYGWKGLDVIGNKVEAEEYLRYCKYLLARYGNQPAMWLLSVDGGGYAPGIVECGEMLEKWDAYRQPTGLHYSPFDDYLATWAIDLPNPRLYCLHENKTHQDKNWLDFQWAQTGHDGLHLYHKVEKMYDNLPTKAVAAGEPTYEGMNDGKNGLGWWQGEDAWNELMHGGTMGVVYGAAALWQWKITKDEPGWETWTDQLMSWKEAKEMEGSHYVGLVAKILKKYNLTDIERRWDLSGGKPLLAKEGKLYIAYLKEGGKIKINSIPAGMHYRWVDPRNGQIFGSNITDKDVFTAPDAKSWVLIVSENP